MYDIVIVWDCSAAGDPVGKDLGARFSCKTDFNPALTVASTNAGLLGELEYRDISQNRKVNLAESVMLSASRIGFPARYQAGCRPPKNNGMRYPLSASKRAIREITEEE